LLLFFWSLGKGIIHFDWIGDLTLIRSAAGGSF